MADPETIRKYAITALSCIEKVSSFAASIDPLFGVVSSLVGIAHKGMVKGEPNPLEEDFQEINSKLEAISKKNHKCLRQIQIDEINENYGKYEEFIKHQYGAFNTMVARLKKDPEGTKNHMETYEKIYEKDKSDLSLNVFYNGVMGTGAVFGRNLLKVYMDHCDGDLEIMEHRCSHLAHLFHMGLIALMAYTAVTEDDEDEVREKWAKRVADIQKEMEKVLSQCKDKQASTS
ncbi:hypothetical protein WMY93_019779 [Mugilogobius chulae]|uniref:Rapunzel 2 n=1 Tax=Mugilogobius chulae TaxID=88201 RepID=A0AAW0NM67_9GOBI